VHRFLVFFSKKLSAKLFERPVIYFFMIIPWIGGFVMDGIGILIGQCVKSFNHTGFNLFYNCTPNPPLAGEIQRQFQAYFQIVMPLVCLLMYLAVYLKMVSMYRKSVQPLENQSDEHEKRERSFLIQAFIICLSLTFETIIFHAVSFTTTENLLDGFYAALLFEWVMITNAALNPILLIIFNETIRGLAAEFFGIKLKSRITVQTPCPVSSARSTIGIKD
jgi:hypothetical protein